MEHFFFIVAALSFLLSGTLSYFLKKSFTTTALTVLTPVVLLLIYIFLTRDEFGYWTLALMIGLCYCLIGSILGTLLASQLTKNVTGQRKEII